jgi:hypothetical protein
MRRVALTFSRFATKSCLARHASASSSRIGQSGR